MRDFEKLNTKTKTRTGQPESDLLEKGHPILPVQGSRRVAFFFIPASRYTNLVKSQCLIAKGR